MERDFQDLWYKMTWRNTLKQMEGGLNVPEPSKQNEVRDMSFLYGNLLLVPPEDGMNQRPGDPQAQH